MESRVVSRACEVRELPSESGVVFYNVTKGKILRQLSKEVERNGIRWVPIAPRGWVLESALEAVTSDEGQPSAESLRSSEVKYAKSTCDSWNSGDVVNDESTTDTASDPNWNSWKWWSDDARPASSASKDVYAWNSASSWKKASREPVDKDWNEKPWPSEAVVLPALLGSSAVQEGICSDSRHHQDDICSTAAFVASAIEGAFFSGTVLNVQETEATVECQEALAIFEHGLVSVPLNLVAAPEVMKTDSVVCLGLRKGRQQVPVCTSVVRPEHITSQSLIGTIKSFTANKGGEVAWISCKAISSVRMADVYLHATMSKHLRIGDVVRFQVRLNAKGLPQVANNTLVKLTSGAISPLLSCSQSKLPPGIDATAFQDFTCSPPGM